MLSIQNFSVRSVKLFAIRRQALKRLEAIRDGRFGRDLTPRQRTPSSPRRRPIAANAAASPCDSWRPRAYGGRAETGCRHTEDGTEARRVPQSFEPLQTSLAPPDRLVRVLDAVILAPAAAMGDGRQHDGFRRRVARQPI